MTSTELIKQLDLVVHPEGGWYSETYRATQVVPQTALTEDYGSSRTVSTSIHFLLQGGQKSHLHRLRSDEIWYFHAGQPIRVLTLAPDGNLQSHLLGSTFAPGMTVDLVIPAGTWFAADLNGNTDPEDFALISCVVTPGFEFEDFELGARAQLQQTFPAHARLIGEYTRAAD